ncbi:MAG: amidohydrolase family protein [Acidobacteriota bacterium]|nr:amidohydrolase family protein [Acidobacteriota bacterium]
MPDIFSARWVLPIAQAPIANGWVAVEDGRITQVGSGRPPATVTEFDGVILPGLVNAHTHLELSWMRGQVAPAQTMPQWVESLMALRRTVGHEPAAPILEGIREARDAGTALVGDITNTLAACEGLSHSGMSGAIFRELLGFNVIDPASVVAAARAQIDALPGNSRMRASIVPHAPYSVSPALLRAIADVAGSDPISIHLGESAEEIEFLREGTGPWRELLTKLGAWSDTWQAPGVGPVDYIAAQGLLNEKLLAVHCVHLTDAELRKLAAAGATVVACPRSNRWSGAGLPPVARFYAAGVRVAVGTDSLSSVEDLNVFAELRLMRELAPDVSARELLASATRHGADALGFGDELGTLEPGKRAELIAVRAPATTVDVEEYLLTGIEPSQITWFSGS